MKLQALLFDLDNTLYAYEPCNQAGIKALRSFLCRKLTLTPNHFNALYTQARAHVHQTLHGQAVSHSRLLYIKTVCEIVQPGITDSTVWQQGEHVFWQAYFGKMKLRPGIRNLLRQASRHGYKIAMITDLTTTVQISKIRLLSLEPYINVVVTSEEVGKEKPHPAMVKRALRLLHCQASTALIIGDDARDQTVAKRCRIPFYKLSTDHAVAGLAKLLV